jgi:hypothetical protein
MTLYLMIGLHHFFLEMPKKCCQDSVSRIECIAKILVCLVISLIRNRLKTAL